MAQIKKLIEVALPLEAINAESAREKSIRHGHPSTLHLWWARRPLATARAVIWSSLVDDPSSHPEQFPTEEAQNAERERLFEILKQLVVMNLFGDVNQTITLHGMTSWRDLGFIRDVHTLDENFRNTNQIVDFCNHTFPFKMKKVGVDMESVGQFDTIADALRRARNKVRNSVFIVKDDYALKDLRDLLSGQGITDYEAYTVKEAKGLEFKSVCVFDSQMTRSEAYIAYTRALVDLIVIHELPRNEKNHVTLIIAGDDPDDEVLEVEGE